MVVHARAGSRTVQARYILKSHFRGVCNSSVKDAFIFYTPPYSFLVLYGLKSHFRGVCKSGIKYAFIFYTPPIPFWPFTGLPVRAFFIVWVSREVF